jgi:Protein of unknown function (DUF1592)/Protein of unknown function (DUF1588)/Protein of unknown function (DUF1595)/Protein of unknown function (DUF1585)
MPARQIGTILLKAITVVLVTMSCTGLVSGTPDGKPGGHSPSAGTGVTPVEPQQPQVGVDGFEFATDAIVSPRLRLKSNAEVYSSLREIFNLTTLSAATLPAEAVDKQSGFSNNSSAHVVGQEMFLSVQALAQEAAAQVAEAHLRKPCTGTNASGLACATALIRDSGRKLFSRDLTQEEVDSLAKVFTAVVAKQSETEGLRAVVEAMVQLPSFLYRTEAGAPGQKSPQHPLTPFEVAAALSSFLWDSGPDAALLEAAASGALSTTNEVETQARRMLKDQKAKVAFGRFMLQWLDVRKIELQPKDATAYPTYSPDIAKAMLEETTRFAVSTVFEKDSTLKTLLSGKTTYLNKTLSGFYGFGNVSEASFQEVAVPKEKAGILTHGSFLVSHSGEIDTSPVKTGLFVRRRVLCNEIPDAPVDAPTSVEPAKVGQTVQDTYPQHKTSGCSGCHLMMNPIGFGFEHLDALGKPRATYNGLPIDSSGEIMSADYRSKKPFAANGLYDVLASVPEASSCFVLRTYQYALGRIAGNQDKATLDVLAKQFAGDTPRIDELLVGIVTAPAFLTRQVN